MAQQKQNQIWRGFLYLLLFIGIMAVIFYFHPDKLAPSLKATWSSLWQFIMIFPAIILLMGIFSVLVTPELIEKNFGRDTGIASAFKALALGSLMSTGPYYLMFPMAKTLLDKGARISAIIIFVAAWNGTGVIAELIEFHFMGAAFMIIRLTTTALLILAMGYVGEFLVDLGSKKPAAS